jgi:hypothetical protein
MATHHTSTIIIGSGLSARLTPASTPGLTNFSVPGVDAKGYQVQLSRLGKFGPRDVVIYGIVGEPDIDLIASKSLLIIDRYILAAVETHISNLRHLHSLGCQKMVFIYYDGKKVGDPSFDDLHRIVILGERGILPRLKKLKTEEGVGPLELYLVKESSLAEISTLQELLSQL